MFPSDSPGTTGPTRRWLSTDAAAAELGIVTRTLYGIIDRGELPAYRFGRVIRLQASDISTFIAESHDSHDGGRRA